MPSQDSRTGPWTDRTPYSPPAADDPHGLEYVRDETPQEPPAEQIARATNKLAHHARELGRLVELLEQRNTPPNMIDPLPALNSTGWTFTDEAKEQSRSFGVLNPSKVNVYVGFDTGRATAASRSIAVPANSMMILPFAAWNITFGIDPADQPTVGAATIVVYAWRYKTVQPAYLEII